MSERATEQKSKPISRPTNQTGCAWKMSESSEESFEVVTFGIQLKQKYPLG